MSDLELFPQKPKVERDIYELGWKKLTAGTVGFIALFALAFGCDKVRADADEHAKLLNAQRIEQVEADGLAVAKDMFGRPAIDAYGPGTKMTLSLEGDDCIVKVYATETHDRDGNITDIHDYQIDTGVAEYPFDSMEDLVASDLGPDVCAALAPAKLAVAGTVPR